MRPCFSILISLTMDRYTRQLLPVLIFVGSCGTDGNAICPPLLPDIATANYAEVKKKVENAVRFCYKNGQRFFYVGGAIGFDTIAAESVLRLKEEFPDIVLIVVVPFPQQDKLFNSSYRNRYFNILNMADEVITISDSFSNFAYLKRNDYMISHSSQLIAYWDEISLGGTSYTVRKAYEKKLTIYNLYK